MFQPVDGMCMLGVSVSQSLLAVKQEGKVQKHPIPKRRRGWRVVRVSVPCAYQMGDRLVVHPTIYEQMKRELAGGKS